MRAEAGVSCITGSFDASAGVFPSVSGWKSPFSQDKVQAEKLSMICEIEQSSVKRSSGRENCNLEEGMLVMTRDGELGQVVGLVFGVVGVWIEGEERTTYQAVEEVMQVICPADVVTKEERIALHG